MVPEPQGAIVLLIYLLIFITAAGFAYYLLTALKVRRIARKLENLTRILDEQVKIYDSFFDKIRCTHDLERAKRLISDFEERRYSREFWEREF